MRAEPEWMSDAGMNARFLFEKRYTLAGAVNKWWPMLEDVAGPLPDRSSSGGGAACPSGEAALPVAQAR